MEESKSTSIIGETVKAVIAEIHVHGILGGVVVAFTKLLHREVDKEGAAIFLTIMMFAGVGCIYAWRVIHHRRIAKKQVMKFYRVNF